MRKTWRSWTITEGPTMETIESMGVIHPGEVIREEFLAPLGKSACWLAKGLGMSDTAVGEILNGKRGISPATALRLERFLGCSAEFWLNLQAAYELDAERERMGGRLETIAPADLDEEHRQYLRATEARRARLHAALAGER